MIRARVEAERAERIRQENEELEETVFRLAMLAKTHAANAESMGYDRGQGFGEQLDAMKESLGEGEAALAANRFEKAKEYFEATLAAAAWCEENAPLREAAHGAREAARKAREATGTEKRRAETRDGGYLGEQAWQEGEKQRQTAETAFAEARFKEATESWNAAVAAYGKAGADARAAKAGQGLTAVREGKAKESAGRTKIIMLPGGAEMEMVWCPAGAFRMGSENGVSDEKPVHQVTLTKGFWMAKTEVTQKQWNSVMGNNPSHFVGNDLPVESVSWEEVQVFCRLARLSLPTEAEWEYACRADGGGERSATGWYGEGFDGKTHPVGGKEPNAWGLYDMYGNVWEWCEDWYESGYYAQSPGMDPKGPDAGENRVLRGGSYWFDPRNCRSAFRFWYNPASHNRSLGFRPVARQD